MQSWPQGLRGSLLAQLPTLLILAALGGLAWWGYANDWRAPKLSELFSRKTDDKGAPDEQKDEPDLKPVELAASAITRAGIESHPILLQENTRKVSAPARLAYDQNWYAHLSTRAPGVVWKVNKVQGDPVKKDEVLALIAAEALGKAKADFLQSLIEVEIRRRTVQRLRSLGESVPESQRVDAELALRQSRTRLLSDQQTLNNLGFSVSIDEFARLSEDEAAQKLRVLGLPADLRNDPNVPANLLPLKALFDGMVVERDIVVGEVAGASPPQFAVANLEHLWIWLSLRPEDARVVRAGQEVEFIPEGDTEPLARGLLRWISPEVDEKTRLVQARVEIRNPLTEDRSKMRTEWSGWDRLFIGDLRSLEREFMRPNTYGTGEVILERLVPRLMIPSSAVQVDAGESFVFVKMPAESSAEKITYEPHRVKLGIRDGDQIEVLSGLDPGADVVTVNSLRLKTEMLKSRIGGGD